MHKIKTLNLKMRFDHYSKLLVRLVAAALLCIAFLQPAYAVAASNCGKDANGNTVSKPCCGYNASATHTSIDIGCKGKGNSITDATFGIIRFLTNGVGVVLVASMVYAGIQYTSSRGDPSATAAAINRIRSNVFALLLFAFAYALLNYIIPGKVLST